jgi:predicted DNA-binding ArsR family transcriptional regulator
MWQHIFGDFAGESITSSTSRMKGGDSDRNRSDLDKSNILKPTFDILTKEGRKTFKAYHTNLVELSLSRCEVTR